MIKPGDTVRYLNAVGGGRVTRVEGRMAYVEEDGFENPVLVSDLVVTLPAGHDNQKKGPALMFDQKAVDAARTRSSVPATHQEPASAPIPPVEETPHGNRLNITLAFEPDDVRRLSETAFSAVIVNDSNYWLRLAFSRRADDDQAWTLEYECECAPNELVDVARLSHADLGRFERIQFQCIAFKKGKPFESKPVVNVSRRLDLTKFHKLHCFRQGIYFDSHVIEIPLVKDDVIVGQPVISNDIRAELGSKYRIDADNRKKRPAPDPAANPNKLLPPVEVDLHIGELTDSIAGLEARDMLELQLREVERVMKQHARRIGQKIVFIHGKGNGVLRQEMTRWIRRNYPKADIQDASFQEYGFGASLITIR